MIEHAYIPIKEYKTRTWGKDGTLPTDQAIRNQIRRGELPAKKIGKSWFIDWKLCNKQSSESKKANLLVNKVLRG